MKQAESDPAGALRFAGQHRDGRVMA